MKKEGEQEAISIRDSELDIELQRFLKSLLRRGEIETPSCQDQLSERAIRQFSSLIERLLKRR